MGQCYRKDHVFLSPQIEDISRATGPIFTKISQVQLWLCISYIIQNSAKLVNIFTLVGQTMRQKKKGKKGGGEREGRPLHREFARNANPKNEGNISPFSPSNKLLVYQ